MDGWCTENCRLGNCPPTLCTCDCRVPTQVLVCKPDSSKFGPRDDGVKWCLNTCRAGHCPRDYCQCHILYRQQPRPVTEGLWGTAGYCYRGLLIEAAIATGIVSPQQMSLLWTFFLWNATCFYYHHGCRCQIWCCFIFQTEMFGMIDTCVIFLRPSRIAHFQMTKRQLSKESSFHGFAYKYNQIRVTYQRS